MVTLRDTDASTLGLIWDHLSDDEREMIRSISFGEVMEELSVKEKAVAALVWAYHKNLPVRTLIEMTIVCIKKVDNKTKDTPCKPPV